MHNLEIGMHWNLLESSDAIIFQVTIGCWMHAPFCDLTSIRSRYEQSDDTFVWHTFHGESAGGVKNKLGSPDYTEPPQKRAVRYNPVIPAYF